MLEEVKQKKERMDFLSSLIAEKTSEANALSKEVAVYRKKNGQALKADTDIKIYELNARIAADKKFIEKCKQERKTLRAECGEILRGDYIAERDFRKKVEIEELFSEVYENKAHLYTETDDGYKAVFEVYTKQKKLSGNVASVLKAGIRADTGRIIALPEVEVYKYSAENDGAIAFSDGTTVEPERKKNIFAKILDFFKRK